MREEKPCGKNPSRRSRANAEKHSMGLPHQATISPSAFAMARMALVCGPSKYRGIRAEASQNFTGIPLVLARVPPGHDSWGLSVVEGPRIHGVVHLFRF